METAKSLVELYVDPDASLIVSVFFSAIIRSHFCFENRYDPLLKKGPLLKTEKETPAIVRVFRFTAMGLVTKSLLTVKASLASHVGLIVKPFNITLTIENGPAKTQLRTTFKNLVHTWERTSTPLVIDLTIN